MSWQAGVIATGVISALAQMVGKRQVMRMGAFQSGVIRDLTTLVLVGGVVLARGMVPQSIPWQAGVIFLVGVMESVSMAAYYAAQREEMAATAVFAYPLSQLLIVLLSSIFFAEWKYFDLHTSQGMINTLAVGLTLGLMLMYREGKNKIKGRFRWSWVLIFSAVIVAFANIQSKWAVSQLHYPPATAMVYEFAGILLGGTVYVRAKKQSLRVGWGNMGWGVLQGLLFGGSALWYLTLLTNHPLAIASVMRRVTIVLMTAGAGLWGWGEHRRLSFRQIAALVAGLAVFGLVMGVNR